MNYEKLIQKTEVQIGSKTFCISKIPAIEATAIYPSVAKYYSDYGLLGLTMFDMELTKRILSYTAAYNNGAWESLDLDSRIAQSLPDQSDLKKLTIMMVKENWGFLTDGSLRDLLGLAEEAEESGS